MAVDGKPSVTVPKLNERAVQDSVLAIRQRLAVLDAAVRVLQNTGSNQQTISNLQTQVAVLQNQINLISGGIFLAQNPNMFFAGPIEGSAVTPEFRLIDWLDLPPVSDLPDQSGLAGNELVVFELSGVRYQATAQQIADLAPVNRGLALVSTDHLVDTSIRLYVVDASLGSVTLTLPSGNLPSGGTVPITVRRSDASSSLVSIAASSGETIDGAFSLSVPVGSGVTVLAAGSAGWVST